MALELVGKPIKRERNELNLETVKAGFPAIQKALTGLVLEAPLVNKIVFTEAKKMVAKPHKLTDPNHGPMIAVRLNILTRKTLGGIQTNLDSQVVGPDGKPVDGLYAAGEVAGFGGGGVHGYNALEGTFLGGCIFSGRNAGRAGARND